MEYELNFNDSGIMSKHRYVTVLSFEPYSTYYSAILDMNGGSTMINPLTFHYKRSSCEIAVGTRPNCESICLEIKIWTLSVVPFAGVIREWMVVNSKYSVA